MNEITAVQAVQLVFDYGQLDSETRIVVQQEDKEFDRHMEDAGVSFLRACHNLARIHAVLRYKRPGFVEYCNSKPGLSERTAYRMVDVAKKFANLANITAAPSALYLLAAPSTPDFIRNEFIERTEHGEIVTYSSVKQAQDTYRASLAAPLPFEPTGTDDLDDLDDEGEEVDEAGLTAREAAAISYVEGVASESGVSVVVLPHLDPDDGVDLNDMRQDYARQVLADAAIEYGLTPADLDTAVYDGDEWYTPDDLLAAARTALGGIDLDPASCAAAQEKVQATRFYTKADNGLALPWFGRVWCNPPYSYPKIEQFTTYAADQYEAGNCEAVILLVNNCTDAGWFFDLATHYPVLFTRGRSKFWRPNQETFATRQGQAIFYLGPWPDRFFQAFADLAYAPNRGV